MQTPEVAATDAHVQAALAAGILINQKDFAELVSKCRVARQANSPTVKIRTNTMLRLLNTLALLTSERPDA